MGVFLQSSPRFQGILEDLLVHWLETEDLDECDEAIHAVLYVEMATGEDDVVSTLFKTTIH